MLVPKGALFGIERHQFLRGLVLGFALIDVDQVVFLQGHKIEIIRSLAIYSLNSVVREE